MDYYKKNKLKLNDQYNNNDNSINSSINNNNSDDQVNLLSKSPDSFKYGSIDDKEWRHGVPKVSSKLSNSFLRSSTLNSPFSSQTNLIGNHNNQSNETNSESEEYTL